MSDSEQPRDWQEDNAHSALVPAEGVFEGQVAVAGDTRIDGTVRGSLRGPGTLLLGPTAKIEGPIECEGLRSEGQIMGPVIARRSASLGPGSLFEGDLQAPILEVDEAAVWNGRARVGPAVSRADDEHAPRSR